ncbi:biotin/lipoyl-containing protein [Candidatus Villigracilis affinis]|uniref:biotin/lipoyl-containing protein n=1 Tax=Candidatus Villigracilis affinis TaxID=3140682 RepID=UPI001D5407B4|nr:hypothetical protein [Anaerolineales bacterium]
MAETISMPKLGFDMAEGLLVRWVKQVGENINKGDVLAEIETDKATVEVESSASGVVLQLIVDQGTMVPVNAPIAVVGAAGEKWMRLRRPQTADRRPKPRLNLRRQLLLLRAALPPLNHHPLSIISHPSSKPLPSPKRSPAIKKWTCPKCRAPAPADESSARILNRH